MDGNRRWAKEQELPTLEGHRRGHEVFLEFVRYIRDAHIPHAVFYAFSTENWQRTEAEVGYLMQLFEQILRQLLAGADEERVRVRIVGRRTDFSPLLQELMAQVEAQSASYGETTIWIALSYGGQAEIIEAVNEAVRRGEAVSEDDFAKLLWSADMPDPDIIVRPGGEQRLSNFMTWRSVYSELLFLDKHWPALTKDDFDDILKQYAARKRRKGK